MCKRCANTPWTLIGWGRAHCPGEPVSVPDHPLVNSLSQIPNLTSSGTAIPLVIPGLCGPWGWSIPERGRMKSVAGHDPSMALEPAQPAVLLTAVQVASGVNSCPGEASHFAHTFWEPVPSVPMQEGLESCPEQTGVVTNGKLMANGAKMLKSSMPAERDFCTYNPWCGRTATSIEKDAIKNTLLLAEADGRKKISLDLVTVRWTEISVCQYGCLVQRGEKVSLLKTLVMLFCWYAQVAWFGFISIVQKV